MRWIVALIIALSCIASASPSKLQALFESGMDHFRRGDYRQALEEFKGAYQLRPDPVVLFNIGQTYRLLGEHEQSASALRTYLQTVKDPPNREEVEKLTIEEEQLAALMKQPAPPETGIPTEAPPPLPPVTVEPASPLPRWVAKPAAKPVILAEAPLPASARKTPKWVWVVVGAGVALVGGAIGLGVALSSGSSAPMTSLGVYPAVF